MLTLASSPSLTRSRCRSLAIGPRTVGRRWSQAKSVVARPLPAVGVVPCSRLAPALAVAGRQGPRADRGRPPVPCHPARGLALALARPDATAGLQQSSEAGA